MSDLYISWEEYQQKIEALAVKIYQSGWNFNQIICLAKGGLRVGDILSRLYRQPLAILSVASYSGSENRQRGEVILSKHLSMVNEKLGSHVLLVDDLVDSGVSIQGGIHWLKNKYPTEIEEIRTAVLWQKKSSIFQPDYYVDYLSDNPWIHQPFEYYEKITPEQLAICYSRRQ
jgi:hypoxanthine phosphoribosyltransferase